jgi:alpha-D-ribose 1-methylphosphonate 5-triphosphate synthase subunit PhnG
MALIPGFNRADEAGRPEVHDMARALVMAELARIVAEGGATIAALESATLVLGLATGEIFHLGEATVTRMA